MASEKIATDPAMTLACHISACHACPNSTECKCSCHPKLYTKAQLDTEKEKLQYGHDFWKRIAEEQGERNKQLEAALSESVANERQLALRITLESNSVATAIATERERCLEILNRHARERRHTLAGDALVYAATAIRNQSGEIAPLVDQEIKNQG